MMVSKHTNKSGIRYEMKSPEELNKNKAQELEEARNTPESECFDCMDWKRGGTVCPAHAQLRKQKYAEERLHKEILPLHHLLLSQGYKISAVPDGEEGEDVTIYSKADMEVTVIAKQKLLENRRGN